MNDFIEKWNTEPKFKTKVQLGLYTLFVVIISIFAISVRDTETIESPNLNNKSDLEPGIIKELNNYNFIVCTKDYDINILDLKLEGKKRCLVKDFVNGIKLEEYIGKVLK